MTQDRSDKLQPSHMSPEEELKAHFDAQLRAAQGFAVLDSISNSAAIEGNSAAIEVGEAGLLTDYDEPPQPSARSYEPAPSNQALVRFEQERAAAASMGLLPLTEQVGVKTGTAEDSTATPLNAFDKPVVEPFTFPQGADLAYAQAAGRAPTLSGAGAEGGETDALDSAQSTPSDFDLLQIRPDMGPKERDAARPVLVKTCYRPEVIYGDSSYFTPVEPEPSEPWSEDAELLFTLPELQAQLQERTVLGCAYFSSLVPKINVAFCTYLQEHFPLGNFADQQRFNIVLLALFYQMREGDICLNLSNLEQLYDIVAQWQESQLSAQRNIDLEDDAPHGIQYTLRQTRRIQDNERFLLMVKRYAPHSLEAINQLLKRSLAVGFDPKAEPNAPLLFDQDRLYLRRYFYYEQGIVDFVAQVPDQELSAEQRTKLKASLDTLFPRNPEVGGIDWQKVAAAMATTSNFTVISGGPGTGKTTTILRILLLMICLDPNNRNIQLCAPTGKAAARMGEAIGNQLQKQKMQDNIVAIGKTFGMTSDEINSFLPKSAVTVHSLIKVIPNRATPIYNAEHRLSCDVLVVDEVSMLDLALFYKLLMALKPECKLILLGDKDQLASVEAGKVLGDLCARLNEQGADRINARSLQLISELSGYSPEQLLSGKIADHVSLLQFSYRSKDVPEIGQLARIVNDNVCISAQQDEREFSSQLEQEWLARKEQAVTQGDLKVYLEACAQLDELKLGTSAAPQGDESDVCSVYERQDDEAQAQLLRASLEPIYSLLARAAQQTPGRYKPALNLIELRDDSQAESLCLARAQHAVQRGVEDNYAPFLERLEKQNFEVSVADCAKLFELMDRFRILCSNHNGILSDSKLNEAIAKEVKANYLRPKEELRPWLKEKFFPGQIVIITKNDPVLELVNGNVGFCAFLKPEPKNKSEAGSQPADGSSPEAGSQPETENQLVAGGQCESTSEVVSQPAAESKPEEVSATEAGSEPQDDSKAKEESKSKEKTPSSERALRVFIPLGAQEVNGQTVLKVNVISTLLLTHYDTGYAMSIHKSQGSEYNKVEIILSERINRVLTKELVYTGITRARNCVTMVASNKALYYSLAHSVERASGLSMRLAALSAGQAAPFAALPSSTEPVAQVASVAQADSSEPVVQAVPADPAAQEEPLEQAETATQIEPAAQQGEPVEQAKPLEPAVAAKPKRKRRTKAEMEAARAAAAQEAAPVEVKPKRKRRTKAEMEAARAAAAAKARSE